MLTYKFQNIIKCAIGNFSKRGIKTQENDIKIHTVSNNEQTKLKQQQLNYKNSEQ